MNPKELPSNPYTRQPIKKSANLAGRSAELTKIDYYLRLTSEGQSPHLALIGQRGVGKTSILNAVDELAQKRHLLTVRINMNEDKGHSSGVFWRDLYGSMCLAVAKAGGWGGINSPIYTALVGMIFTALVGMIFAQKMPDMSMAVLQFPIITANSSQSLDIMSCPDALIINDLLTIKEEIANYGFTGIVFLIDEADCLGLNRSLMQVLRNIFQVTEGCSLVLAGTEAVFPTLSEVFSPIPRQFHRIDIKPFGHWGKTIELVSKPMPSDNIELLPELDTSLALHELCGGDPAELQLYCHHMYKQVEEGASIEMALLPQVYREVLQEYRANTPSDVDAVLDAIQALPDALLFGTAELRMRRLTFDETCQLSILQRGLQQKRLLPFDERMQITNDLQECFQSLYERNITVSSDSLCLKGSPITDGFWKSYVEAEKGKQWSWNDETFSEAANGEVASAMERECSQEGHRITTTNILETDEATVVEILEQFRARKKITEIPSQAYYELFTATQLARSVNAKEAVDVKIECATKGNKQSFCVSFIGEENYQSISDRVAEWLLAVEPILVDIGVSARQQSVNQWVIPTNDEFARLSWIANMGIGTPEKLFGPGLLDTALSLFNDHKIAEASEVFREMLEYRDHDATRNNLAYCLMLTGEIEMAKEHLALLSESSFDDVLWEHNFAVSEALCGDIQDAVDRLSNLLTKLARPFNSKENCNVLCMLVLSEDCKSVVSTNDMPKPVAILLNLHRLGAIDIVDVTTKITEAFPDDYRKWLPT